MRTEAGSVNAGGTTSVKPPKATKRGNAARLFGYDIFISFALGSPPRGTQSYASDLARQRRRPPRAPCRARQVRDRLDDAVARAEVLLDRNLVDARVAMVKSQGGLRARQKRRFRPRTTDSLAIVTRLRKTGWQSCRRRIARASSGKSDITSIETQEGWLYLAFTLDGCSRRCVAHACRQDMLGES
jgi:hypothetical protein